MIRISIKRAKSPARRIMRAARRLLLGPSSPNILHINLTGFITDPQGPANGMRDQAEAFQANYPGSDFAFFSWGDKDNYLDLFNAILKLITDGNAAGKYTVIIIRGHSYGAAAAIAFLYWLLESHPEIQISCGIFYDAVECPRFDSKPWGMAPNTRSGLWVWQDNGADWKPWLIMPFPHGSPPKTDNPGLQVLDVSELRNPKLYHSSLIADPRVWDDALRCMRNAVKYASAALPAAA